MAQIISDSVVEQIKRSLVEFGYADLTTQIVREAVDKLVAGAKPTEIIGLLAQNMLVENGLLDRTHNKEG